MLHPRRSERTGGVATVEAELDRGREPAGGPDAASSRARPSITDAGALVEQVVAELPPDCSVEVRCRGTTTLALDRAPAGEAIASLVEQALTAPGASTWPILVDVVGDAAGVCITVNDPSGSCSALTLPRVPAAD